MSYPHLKNLIKSAHEIQWDKLPQSPIRFFFIPNITHTVLSSLKNESVKILNQQPTDFWIDACDDMNAKILLINSFNGGDRRKKILICGGAGGKTDPFKIVHPDLHETTNDPLLSK